MHTSLTSTHPSLANIHTLHAYQRTDIATDRHMTQMIDEDNFTSLLIIDYCVYIYTAYYMCVCASCFKHIQMNFFTHSYDNST